MFRILPLLAVALTLPVPLAASDWLYGSSTHFEVYTTGSRQDAAEVLTRFERVHTFFAEFLRLPAEPLHPTRLVVFADEREFEFLRPNPQAIAYFQPGPDRDYIVMQSSQVEVLPVVVHEYVHLVLRHSGESHPVWLSEGMAEFFSTLSIGDGRIDIGRVPRERLRFLNSGVPLMPLARLFDVDRDSPEYGTRAHAGVFYSQSWALVHMLLTSDRYRGGWGRFRALVGGQPASDALWTVYGRTVDDLERDLQDHIVSGRYVYVSSDYEPPAGDVAFPVRSADAFEAGLVMANLLAARGDAATSALAAYDALLRQRPHDLELVEARAHFALRRGADPEALPFLVRAVQAGSRSALLHYEYARLVRSYNPDLRRRLLGRAVELDPADVRYRLEYAAGLVNAGEAATALAVLEPVRDVAARDAFMLFQLRANACVQLGRVAEARQAADLARTYATSDEHRQYAARLIASIRDRTPQEGSPGATAPKAR